MAVWADMKHSVIDRAIAYYGMCSFVPLLLNIWLYRLFLYLGNVFVLATYCNYFAIQACTFHVFFTAKDHSR